MNVVPRSQAAPTPERWATARRWLQKGLTRPVLWLQLGACGALLALCGVDILLVLTHVSCAVYRRSIQGVPGEVVAVSSWVVGASSFLWRLLAQLVGRQYRAAAWSLGLFVLELAVVTAGLALDVDRTLFYCTFEGISINPCEPGLCVH